MCAPEVGKLLLAKALGSNHDPMTAMGNATSNIKAAFRGDPIRWLIVGGALLVGSIAVGTAMMVGHISRARDAKRRTRTGKHRAVAGPSFRSAAGRFHRHPERTCRRKFSSRKWHRLTAFRWQMSTREMHEVLRAKSRRAFRRRRHQCVRCRRNVDQFVRALAGAGYQHRRSSLLQGFQIRHSNHAGSDRTGARPLRRRLGNRRRSPGDRAERASFSGVVTRADHARELREILRFPGARERRRDFDVSSRRNTAGALSACRGDDRAEFQSQRRLPAAFCRNPTMARCG